MVNTESNNSFQRIISRVLSVGYHLSIAVLGTGFMLYMFGQDGLGLVVINAGLLILLATPLSRVAASAALFYFVEGDKKYSLISVVVFLILISSIIVGREI